jgi:hypothetical protein
MRSVVGAGDRAVKLVDGTCISMPDTPENQASYPQPSTQAHGVGFPLARLVGSCVVHRRDHAGGHRAAAGKGSSELDLFRSVMGALSAGDVLLADALYCNYLMIATPHQAGVDALFEQHGARITDFRRGRALGPRDHRVRWTKPKARPAWMSLQQYWAFPKELTLTVGNRPGRADSSHALENDAQTLSVVEGVSRNGSSAWPSSKPFNSTKCHRG